MGRRRITTGQELRRSRVNLNDDTEYLFVFAGVGVYLRRHRKIVFSY